MHYIIITSRVLYHDYITHNIGPSVTLRSRSSLSSASMWRRSLCQQGPSCSDLGRWTTASTWYATEGSKSALLSRYCKLSMHAFLKLWFLVWNMASSPIHIGKYKPQKALHTVFFPTTLPSSLIPTLPSSLFTLPSSLFTLPSSLFTLPPNRMAVSFP